MTIHDRMSFDRRTFLKATGILAVGFSMSGTAAAQSLMAPRGVAKDAIDSWLTITPTTASRFLSARSISAPARGPR